MGDNFISVQRVGVKTFANDVTVFIGNLPLDVQENAVREFFDECGRIQAIRLIRDSKTGVGKGFGFVSFESRDGVVLALEKNGASFQGRDIRVKKAGKEGEKGATSAGEPRRRRRHPGPASKKRKGSTGAVVESCSHDDESEEDAKVEERMAKQEKKQKEKKKRAKAGFSGDKSAKSVKHKKKPRKKLLKGRHSAGKKRAIARLLTA